jgi:hypothetical protein
MKHVFIKHDDCPNPGTCPICDGGWQVCKVCGGGEGALPTDCPGERMTDLQMDSVMDNQTDFSVQRGGWYDPSSHKVGDRIRTSRGSCSVYGTVSGFDGKKYSVAWDGSRKEKPLFVWQGKQLFPLRDNETRFVDVSNLRVGQLCYFQNLSRDRVTAVRVDFGVFTIDFESGRSSRYTRDGKSYKSSNYNIIHSANKDLHEILSKEVR